MPISSAPTFKGGFANIGLGASGQVLTSNGAASAPTFQAAGSTGGIGGSINFASPSGVIDPTIIGFVAAVGPAGTGRIKVTLTANTSFEGLPAGADGQQLFVTVVAGNFLLTLLQLNGATAQSQIYASNPFGYALHDTAQLFFDSGLSSWVLVA